MTIEQVALEAVKKAGNILMKNLDNIENIGLKQKNDFITNVDIAAENAIKRIIENNFPDHSIVAEESKDVVKNSPFTWFIDPISSTQNYIHGLPHFATAIAVQKDKELIFSAVLDPFFNELYYAEKGNGAYLNDKRIQVSSIDNITKALVSVVIQTRGAEKKEKDLKYFNDLLPNIASFRRIGSLALELCYIAAGRLDGQVYLSSDIYSLPAGVLIVQEAGGKCTDVSGKAWTTKSPSIVATNGQIHNEIINCISN